MKYRFGNYKHNSDNYWECKAKNLESAVNQFKVAVLFPEVYCDGSFYDIIGSTYNQDLEMSAPSQITPDMFIPVYEWTDEVQEEEEKHMQAIRLSGKYIHWCKRIKPVIKLKVDECIDVDYSSYESTKLLPDTTSIDNNSETDENEDEDKDENEVAQVQLPSSILVGNKMQARAWYISLSEKKAELERQRSELSQQMKLFEEELKRKRQKLYALETYMGIEEEITVLQKGQKALDDDPIYVHQLKLYMDEEVGITELDDPKLSFGLDFNNIELFDQWITQHHKQYLYHPKSIMAWEIKRRDAHYTDDTFYNDQANKANHLTYFLIRNGDMLYRIYTNVHVGNTTFPTKAAFDSVVEEDREWHRNGEGIRKYVEKNMYILIALQGLIDRTDVFGASFAGKVNLIDPTKFNDEYVKLVRDAEFDHLLTDGRLTWREWKEQNEKTLTVGSRVLFFVPMDYRWGKYKDDLQDRVVSNCRYSDWLPVPQNGLYQILEVDGYKYKIKFQPDDKVWVKNNDGSTDYRTRKNKMSFWAYDSELLNLDEITFNDIDYYLHTRAYRSQYLDILPALKQVYTQKKQEEQEEQPFVDLLKSKFDFDNVCEIKVMINHWKTKNKWRRAISIDDRKAYRMIGSWIEKFQQTGVWKN